MKGLFKYLLATAICVYLVCPITTYAQEDVILTHVRAKIVSITEDTGDLKLWMVHLNVMGQLFTEYLFEDDVKMIRDLNIKTLPLAILWQKKAGNCWVINNTQFPPGTFNK